MTSSHDVYSTQPAFPFLASSLLAPYDMRKATTTHSKHHNNQTTSTTADLSSWDLQPAFDEVWGLSTYRNDARFLFRCGSTIGFSYLKEWNTVNPDVSRDLLGQIPKRLLAYYLLGLQHDGATAQRKSPRVYIIRPGHSSAFSPDALLEAVLEAAATSPQSAALTRDQAIDLLDHVELLTIHDFATATRAISQVSDTLYAMQQQHRRQQTYPNQDDPADDQDEDDDEDTTKQQHLPPTVLFIIEGLDSMAENVIRNSDALRGSAVLMPALRTLTYLSRSYASFVGVVLVNTTGLGAPPSSQAQAQAQPGLSGAQSQSHNDGEVNRGRNNNTMKSAGGLYSVFSRQQNNDAADVDEPVPLLHTLLARTMDQSIDIHLLFQLRKDRAVVEIIKDRTGDGLGKWCVWS